MQYKFHRHDNAPRGHSQCMAARPRVVHSMDERLYAACSEGKQPYSDNDEPRSLQ